MFITWKADKAMVDELSNKMTKLVPTSGSSASTKLVVPIVIFVGIVVSLLFLLAAGFGAAEAQPSDLADTAGDPPDTAPEKQIAQTPQFGGRLVVPVFPRGTPGVDAPVSNDLRDSYILLEDGSVLSVADWILGSLSKNDTGVGMSDYQNRLFLGQVARAMVGMDEKLVNHSYVYTGPTISYRPPPKPGAAMQALQGVVGLIGGAFFPGTPEGWHPAKSGGAFSPLQRSGGDAAILFEEYFSGAMLQSVEDIRDASIYQIMLDDARKAAASGSAGESKGQ